jgi:hypothetical protein
MAAPKGSHNRKKAAHWTDALKLELANYDGGSVKQGEALREIALNVVKDALDRTSPHYWNAVQEIGNRLDGKPAQAVQVDGDGDGGPIRHALEVLFVEAASQVSGEAATSL